MNQTIIENREWRWVFVASFILLLTISVPFIWAYAVSVTDYNFMGTLVNPFAGASYQAMMIQGFSGSWQFQLLYTAEPHQGVHAYLLYLGLGHVARILNLPVILVFHVARLLTSLLMFLVLYQFMAEWTEDVNQRRIAWMLAVLGSGFGWVALIFGQLTPDILLSPEAFPIQAAYANPHYPFAIALGVWIAYVLLVKATGEGADDPSLVDGYTPGLMLAVIMLVTISPFLFTTIVVGYSFYSVWLWRKYKTPPSREMKWGLSVLLFGLPIIVYNIWVYSPQNPVFYNWLHQSIVPVAPLWKLLVAFGPLVALAGIGLWKSWHLLQDREIFLMGWIGSSLILFYLPLNIPHHFLTAITVPLAVFAARGLWRVIIPRITSKPVAQHFSVVAILALVLPTTVLAIVLPILSTIEETPSYPYYLSNEETSALEWINHYTNSKSVFLSSPEMGLFIPTTGRRVVDYNPGAQDGTSQQQSIIDFYSGEDCSLIKEKPIDYVMIDRFTRELSEISSICPLPNEIVYRSEHDEVVIYRVQESE